MSTLNHLAAADRALVDAAVAQDLDLAAAGLEARDVAGQPLPVLLLFAIGGPAENGLHVDARHAAAPSSIQRRTVPNGTGDYRILHALAATHGFVLQASAAPKGGTIITAMLAAQAAKGDLAELVADAMADDRICGNESDRITRGVMQVIVRLLEVSQHAEAAAERGGV